MILRRVASCCGSPGRKGVLLGGLDNVEPAVLARVEANTYKHEANTPESRAHSLFLRTLDVDEHAIKAEYALLQRARMVCDLTGFRGRVATGFGLDHDVEVDELLGERGHVVLKAEGVFARGVGREDIVALPLALAVKDDLLARIFHLEVDVKRATGLNLFGAPLAREELPVQQIRTA